MTPPLAALGADPAFPAGLPFVRPSAPPRDAVFERLAPSYDAGRLTNGPLVAELEAAVADRLGVAHVVAMSTCTTGLMLVLRVLEHLGELAPDGPVLMPSFTFSATAHAAAWNARRCRFVECDASSFQIDVDDAKARVDGAAAILATHLFGAPCAPEAVEELGAAAGVPVLFDAAHAFGATRDGRAIGGFGSAEVFSLTPTKPVVAGEGGLVATNRADVAEALRIGRDYANAGDYDTRFVGLNGRMSELHAAVALCSLDRFDADLRRRRDIAARYTDDLAGVPGIGVQQVDGHDASTFKDFTVTVDPEAFGIDRDRLVQVMRAEGVDTRCYFDPPVHRQQSHARDAVSLPVTDTVAARVVSLPIYPSLTDADQEQVAAIIATAHAYAETLRS
jgi:dTDP-4-amino-4,6-dideoxygalactose transaminase